MQSFDYYVFQYIWFPLFMLYFKIRNWWRGGYSADNVKIVKLSSSLAEGHVAFTFGVLEGKFKNWVFLSDARVMCSDPSFYKGHKYSSHPEFAGYRFVAVWLRPCDVMVDVTEKVLWKGKDEYDLV